MERSVWYAGKDALLGLAFAAIALARPAGFTDPVGDVAFGLMLKKAGDAVVDISHWATQAIRRD